MATQATMEAAAGANAPRREPKLAWWMVAGLVGADIGTSVFYGTGVLFPIVGFAAPIFVAIVACAMWLFKTTYQEGCAVNPVNGGSYAMVLQTIGRRAALVLGSLTLLVYLATAVVSALSGALYLSSLWHEPWPMWQLVLVAAAPVVGFGVLNLFGLRGATKIVFGVAVFHFVTLIAIDLVGLYLVATQGAHWERLSQGFGALTPHAVLMAFAAAFLGITGFESASQIIEEIEQPSWRAIQKIYGAIVLLVSFTAPVSSLLVVLLLSDADIARYQTAFLSGLAMHEGGTPALYILVANACTTLFAAVNTAYAGATGLMTTMGKQGNLPAVVLTQWRHRHPALQGYPFVVLPFMTLCLVMLAIMPGALSRLGQVYGMAFVAVMIGYCLGVVLLRVRQPAKVARSPYVSHWTITWGAARLPLAPIVGGSILVVAEIVLLTTSHGARELLIQLFLGVLLVMAFYRLGQVETRMVRLPDLRLGLGKYRGLEKLPDLPTYVICTTQVSPRLLVTEISYLLRKFGENVEIVIFHAEEQNAPHGVVSEGLERLISQQLEEFYEGRDVVLSVKVLPGNLIEVLTEYNKTRKFEAVFVSTGHDPEASEALRAHLANEMTADVVRLDEKDLPKGPGVWYTQWSQGFRHRDRNWHPDDDYRRPDAYEDDREQ